MLLVVSQPNQILSIQNENGNGSIEKNSTDKMAVQSYMKYIYVALGFLVADAAIEMGFVATTVAFLHASGKGPFTVATPSGSTFQLAGHPVNLIVDQGHTSNAAAGTCIVLLGFGGLLALTLEHRERRRVCHILADA